MKNQNSSAAIPIIKNKPRASVTKIKPLEDRKTAVANVKAKASFKANAPQEIVKKAKRKTCPASPVK